MPVGSNVEFVASEGDPRRAFLLFLQNGLLMAQRVDMASLHATGNPSIIAGQITATPAMGAAVSIGDFSANADVLVYRSGNSGFMAVQSWIDRLP